MTTTIGSFRIAEAIERLTTARQEPVAHPRARVWIRVVPSTTVSTMLDPVSERARLTVSYGVAESNSTTGSPYPRPTTPRTADTVWQEVAGSVMQGAVCRNTSAARPKSLTSMSQRRDRLSASIFRASCWTGDGGAAGWSAVL